MTHAQGYKVTFLICPALELQNQNWGTRPSPPPSALGYLSTYLIYFSSSLINRRGKKYCWNPSQTYKSTNSHPPGPLFSPRIPFSHIVALSGTLFQPCLPHGFHISFNDFSFPLARVKGSVPIATGPYLCHSNCYPIVFKPLDNLSLSLTTHTTPWFLGSSGLSYLSSQVLLSPAFSKDH